MAVVCFCELNKEKLKVDYDDDDEKEETEAERKRRSRRFYQFKEIYVCLSMVFCERLDVFNRGFELIFQIRDLFSFLNLSLLN